MTVATRLCALSAINLTPTSFPDDGRRGNLQNVINSLHTDVDNEDYRQERVLSPESLHQLRWQELELEAWLSSGSWHSWWREFWIRNRTIVRTLTLVVMKKVWTGSRTIVRILILVMARFYHWKQNYGQEDSFIRDDKSFELQAELSLGSLHSVRWRHFLKYSASLHIFLENEKKLVASIPRSLFAR
jgi:hypothetical protein